MASKEKIEFQIRKGNRVVLNGKVDKVLRTNRQVLTVARKALAEKLKVKKGLHRIAVMRDGELVGEWTCNPLPKKKSA